MKKILLRSLRYGNRYALVDDADYSELSKYVWSLQRGTTGIFYATRGTERNGKQKSYAMHRQIMGFPNSMIDHKDRNGLNNQRENLRPATRSQNGANYIGRTKIRRGKFKGVTKYSHWDGFHAQIAVNQKHMFLGSFKNEEDAARAYDKAAKKYFGEFAYLNFPEEK